MRTRALILLIMIAALAGCGTPSLNPIKWFYEAGGEAAGLDPQTPLKAMSIMESIKTYRPWQWFGILTTGGGMLLIVGSFTKGHFNFIEGNKDRFLGGLFIAFGFLFSWWGSYAPVNQDKIAVVLLVGAVASAVWSIVYIARGAGKARKNAEGI